jgi:hypothetical protein
LQGDHSIRALNGMWFCHTRPEDIDLFYLPYGLRQDRIARWLTGTVSAQRAATAAQKIATRGEIGGSGWSIEAPEPGRQREDLDRSPFATAALTSLRKERLNMCRPMKPAIPGFLP